MLRSLAAVRMFRAPARHMAIAGKVAATMASPSAHGRPVDDLIQADHASILELWDRYQAVMKRGEPGADQVRVADSVAAQSTRADQEPDFKSSEAAAIANELVREIAVHSVAEELVVYPVLARIRGDEVTQHLIDEQQLVKEHLYALDKMEISHPDFTPRLDQIIKELRHHMHQEESVELPELRAQLNDERLVELGQQFDAVKPTIPTRPHPSAPTRPALEALVGMMTAPFDKARDKTRDFAERRVK